ncbi:allatostatins MIP [Drosophila subobscura]|uniref:allatostatins MIP n=1 Tax=Drosophila subobscura TaxID=7241 RepID=UPI00155AA14C|nr:allatostatins MIP [Drosophila subobscura]XP_034656718.1 allatostatins MIP [Drosophila subobscura]
MGAHTKTRIQSRLLLLAVLLLGSACSSLASGSGVGSGVGSSSTASNEPNGLSEQVVEQLSDSDLYNNKRAWQSLQSSWGKRSRDVVPDVDGDDNIYMTGHFVPLVITDGTNTIDWDTFERLASNQDMQPQLQQQQQQQQRQQQQSGEDMLEDPEAAGNMEKRAWKSMNVAWGKRRQAQGWNKFRGAWGKREPTWNNLKGMWGKRDQWQKLHGGWGKRSMAAGAALN